MSLFETVVQDVRYGARVLSRSAGFSGLAATVLALGIGVNATVFTAYKAMVARPLDARDAGRMVNFALMRPGGTAEYKFSFPDYEAYRDGARSFNGMIAFATERMILSNAGGLMSQRATEGESLWAKLGLARRGASNAEFARAFLVSENYFAVLGAAPLRGRSFESIGIGELTASPAALISENYWQKRFAGDAAILGKTVHLNGAAFSIIGITPHDFVGTSVAAPDFWVPLHLSPLVHTDRNWLTDRENKCCQLFGRLASGVTAQEAQAEMNLLEDRVRTLHDAHSEASKPATAMVWRGSPFPLPLSYYGGLRFAIALILSAAAMALAVACANAGSLQLARARSRQNELGLRFSLGATRVRVMRQLLTESALLGLLAGGAALLFTWAFTQTLATKFAEAWPTGNGSIVFHVTPDAAALAFVLAISIAAGMMFGLLPALESSSSALVSAFKGKAGTSPARSRRLQDLLVAIQVAASFALMVSGSMFVHSAMRSLQMETGYENKHVIDLEFQFAEGVKKNAARKAAVVRELRERLAAVPGVAGLTSAQAPAAPHLRAVSVAVDGEKSAPGKVRPRLYYGYVQRNYFDTLGIPLFLGRSFSSASERSVSVSESAGKQLWPGQNPVGHTLRLAGREGKIEDRQEGLVYGPAHLVIGVARDTRGIEFDGSDSRQIYFPLPEEWVQNTPILVRTRSDPGQVLGAMDSVVASVDPELVATSATLEEMLRQTGPFIASSLAAAVASPLGVLGFLLAAMGVYGSVRYIVALRTREIGIRMAIGAQKRDIVRMILRESTRPVFAGLAAGMLAMVGISYLLRGILYGLSGMDAVSLAGVSFVFLSVAMLAAYLPSRRAMRIEPMAALRYE